MILCFSFLKVYFLISISVSSKFKKKKKNFKNGLILMNNKKKQENPVCTEIESLKCTFSRLYFTCQLTLRANIYKSTYSS